MRKRSKRYRGLAVPENENYPSVKEAIAMVKKNATAKFDETVEIAIKTGLDPRHSTQQLRGSLVLPHGTGKTVRVLVFASGDAIEQAKEAGADFVGGQDLVDQIQGGWLDFDACIATPDMMRFVGKLGRVLGPRGLMPNPKLGSVTKDVAKAVSDAKGGKVEYRVDKFGNIANGIGKASFDEEKLYENFRVYYNHIIKAKPSAAKGTYIKSVTLSSSQGVGVQLDANAARIEVERI